MGLQLLSSLEDTLSRQSSYTGASRLDRSALVNGCAQQYAIGVPLYNDVLSMSPPCRQVVSDLHPVPDTGATGSHEASTRTFDGSAQFQDIDRLGA